MGIKLLLALHIVFAAMWVGADVTLEMLAARAKKTKDPVRMAAFAGDAAFLGKAFFPIVAILTWVAGIALAVAGNYPWKLWMYWGILVVIITTILGAGVIAPASRKLQAGGDGTPPQVLAKRIAMAGHINTVLLILTVFDMVFKPGA